MIITPISTGIINAKRVRKGFHPRFVNLKGRKFGKLTVQNIVRYIDYQKRPDPHTRAYFWQCKCECGRLHIVAGSNLKMDRIVHCRRCSLKARRSAV